MQFSYNKKMNKDKNHPKLAVLAVLHFKKIYEDIYNIVHDIYELKDIFSTLYYIISKLDRNKNYTTKNAHVPNYRNLN